jgi:hypothetical protein
MAPLPLPAWRKVGGAGAKACSESFSAFVACSSSGVLGAAPYADRGSTTPRQATGRNPIPTPSNRLIGRRRVASRPPQGPLLPLSCPPS